jgi:hypothetical protein
MCTVEIHTAVGLVVEIMRMLSIGRCDRLVGGFTAGFVFLFFWDRTSEVDRS